MTSTLNCACGCGCTQPTTITSTLTHLKGAPYARCRSCLNTCTPATSNITDHTYRRWDERRRVNRIQAWNTRVAQRYQDFVGATTDNPHIDTCMQRLAAGQPAGIVLHGPMSTGKTHTAFAYLNRLVNQGAVAPGRIMFGSEHDILGSVANASWADAESVRRHLTNPHWSTLFIDDVGWCTYRRVEDQHALWHHLTDQVTNRRATLIVTTNHSLDSLQEWVGGPAWQRILMASSRTIVEITGYNRRYQRA